MEKNIKTNGDLSKRDYYINRGKVYERFKADFMRRYMENSLYKTVLELLTREADPYEIIEVLLQINDEQQVKIMELALLIPPQTNKATT